jgi:hypothetical protein
MDKIIPPVDRSKLEEELTKKKFLRHTNNGNREIYIIDYHDSPNLMREIGRVREISFRDAGGGTGKAMDIDNFDTEEFPFKQLIVWDPIDKEIIGGYRFKKGADIKVDKDGNVYSPTAHLFKFSELFIKDYLPYTIELGRSFVQTDYQPVKNIKKGIFSLDNVWDGLGALIVEYPGVRYFFGKITMYKHFNVNARDLILFFMYKFFPDPEDLLYPFKPLGIASDPEELDEIFNGKNYIENYKILNQQVRNLKENIPPLVNTYINLSATMKTFGTAINETFGDVEETGILISINDIYPKKKERHSATHHKRN